MAAPIFYRPSPKWQLCAAFCGAVLVHAGAVALAARSATPVTLPVVESAIEVDIVDVARPTPPQQVESLPENPPPSPSFPEPAFNDDHPTPPPARERIDRPSQRLVRPPSAAQRITTGAARVLALSAPRPEYPYEARRQRVTGSGVALLTVDPATGCVTDVRMLRSTGSTVLDNATISGFRRWRFRAGTVSSVQSPITYTLTGAAF